MTSWRLWVALLAVVLGLSPGGPRAAEDQPIPLEPLTPVLYVIGPASAPVCGGVGLVAFLGPGVIGENASTVLRLASPVFTLCGAIPPTPIEERYSCPLDAQALEVIGTVTGLAGVPPAVDLRPVGQLLEELGAAGSVVLTKPRMNELLKQPSVVLQCTQGIPSSPDPTIPPEISEPAPQDEMPFDDSLPPLVAFGDDDVLPLPTVGSVTSPRTTGRPAAVTTPFGRVPFSYASVFVLPFVLLLLMGVVGSSVLRPLDLDQEGQ